MNKFIALVLLVGLTFFLNSCANVNKQEKIDVNITFNKSNKLNFPFIGHGVQWSAYPHADSENADWGFLMTDEKWNKLYKRVDFVNPHIIRVMDVASWRYFKGLDKENQPIVNFDTQEIKSLCKLLDYCQKNNIIVLFGEWGAPGFWEVKDKKPNDIVKANDDRWIDMITQYLDYLIIKKGYTCIKYYNLVNEPNGYWASTDGNWEEWKEGYQKLNTAFIKKGLDKYVTLSGPDAVTQWDHPKHPKKAHDWVYSTVEDLDSITGLYDFHIYADQNLIRTGNFIPYLKPFSTAINKTKKPFVLGELGMKYSGALREENKKRGEKDPYAGPDDSSMFVYDYFYGVDMADAAIQSMLAGVGGAIAWDLDDAMHTVGDLGEKNQLKKWGMWNILAEEFGDLEVDKKPRPWSYTWTLLCNLFPPKSDIFQPKYSSKNDSIRAVASVHEGDFTTAIVNQSKKSKVFQLKTDEIPSTKQLYLYEYSKENRPTNSEGFPVATRKIEKDLSRENVIIEVKGESIIFLSTILIQ
ncbi:hypothetical protein [Tenacibaculum agarivorans]|uniref:hypothetical protein n=1 Tax=Tenacibaculum agarivorans TaxID=1908389 RepID=UPI00094BA823|nr:hypothetical protein [Tenacibaculum agarivorans]